MPKSVAKPTPLSLPIAKKGVRTVRDFTQLMSAMMSDLIEGSISAEVGNATCKAGSNLLKAVEMQHKYGRPASQPNDEKVLVLA